VKVSLKNFKLEIKISFFQDGVNNKTWRCVCAKKLTGARSWCKGRAETWEGDTKGIPKGEHNHQTEHDLAELEYFKVERRSFKISLKSCFVEPTNICCYF